MRKLALFVSGFSAAILLLQYFPGSLTGVLLLLAAIMALAGIAARKKAPYRLRIVALGLAIGTVWNFAYSLVFLDTAAALGGYSGSISATVQDYPQVTDYGCKAEIKIRFDKKPGASAMLYIYDSAAAELRPGDVINFTGRLVLASDKTENDYFASRGIPLLAYADSQPETVGQVDCAKIRFFHRRAAKAIKEKICEIFPDFAQPFMMAIITGDRTLLNGETGLFSVLASVGTAHVVAVSGMHVAFLVSLLRRLFGNRRWLNLLNIPCVLFFMAMTGFSASVVRAGIMQIIVLIGAAMHWEEDGLTSLSFALLLLLAVNPASIKNGGLQLSFAATLGIILFSDRVFSALIAPFETSQRLHRFYRRPLLRKLINLLCSTIASTFGALAFTVPISAVMFGYVSVIAPLANLLILWAVSLAFSLGIICLLAGFVIAPAGAVLAWVPAVFVLYIDKVARLLARIPFASVYTTSVYIRAWLVFAYIELILLSRLKSAGKLWAFLASSLVVLVCSICFSCVEAGSGSLTLSVLNVGQGQSVLLASQGCCAIVDCGGSLGTNAGDIAAEQLAAIGKNHLDLLVLTHYHEDHANGAVELMQRVRVERLLAPLPTDDEGKAIADYAAGQGTEVIYVNQDDYSFELGKAVLTVIPPLGAADDNEAGLSVICTSGDFDAVITGDMGGETELRLIEYADIPDAELLIVGHHGSKNSTTVEFLQAVRPEMAIISVGTNSYGHPAPEVIERINASGAHIYRTDQNGTVTVKLGKEES